MTAPAVGFVAVMATWTVSAGVYVARSVETETTTCAWAAAGTASARTRRARRPAGGIFDIGKGEGLSAV